MTPERWQQIDELFQAAVALEPSERPAFLKNACGSDQIVHDRVAAMLASDDSGWDLIEHPALEVGAPVLADDRPQLTPEQQVGHYQIIHLIGRGGMGEVYLARDKRLNRKIALKLLPAGYLQQDERLRRFEQEAQAASALNHPNILTIHEIGEIDDQQFIATEFVEGETLRDRLKRGGLSSEDAMDIAIQMGGALAAAHSAGIIHRDIKPENIMLRPDGILKVVDFGLAKLTEGAEPRMKPEAVSDAGISSGLVMGTVKYMSPEQAQGKPVDARSDIFSLGVVIYEMLAGRAPFEGDNPAELINSIVEDDPTPLSKLVPDIPVQLEQIVAKAIRKSKAERYETARRLFDELRQVRQAQQLKSLEATGTVPDAGSIPTRISSVRLLANRIAQNPFATISVITCLVIIATVGAFVIRNVGVIKTAGSFENAIAKTISTTHEVGGVAAISPDGKALAFLSQESLLLTPTDGSGVATQLLSHLEGRVLGLVFSSDGQSLFFTRVEEGDGVLYRLSIYGGSPIKVLQRVDSRVSFSPDWQQLAFIRSYPSEGETAVIVANVDGTGEKRLALRKGVATFSGFGLSWSPDGKRIAAIVDGGTANESGLVQIDVSSGAESSINTPTDWPRFRDIEWLSDGSVVVVVTEGGSTATTQIWQLVPPAWTPKKITDNNTTYEGISVAKSAGALLAVERRTTSDLWISSVAGDLEPVQLTRTDTSGQGGVAWMQDGSFVYHMRNQGNDELWRMNPDGSNPRNLTPDSHGNFYPSATADGRYVVFMSRRTGALHVWRHENETGRQTQLTGGADDQFPRVTADGKWIYYVSWDTGVGRVCRVSLNGGQTQQVVNEVSGYPDISPDGKLLAYVGYDHEAPIRRIVSPADASVKYSFHGGPARFLLAHWSRASDALLYLDQKDGAWNVWTQPLTGEPPAQLTHFNDGRIYFFDLSPDGKQLVLSRGSETRALVLIRGS